MFLHRIGSADERFKTLSFHSGMNLVIAEKGLDSTTSDTRNGAGKSSLINIIRYILGGSPSGTLRSDSLKQHTFSATLELEGEGRLEVARPIAPQTQVFIQGRSFGIDDWRSMLGSTFSLPESATRPTVGQLFGQLVRTTFTPSTKIFPSESDLDSAIRIGYLLGLSPDVLTKASQVQALRKNQTALTKALDDGAIPGADLSEPELRARLNRARKKRDAYARNLDNFRVDDQYAVHQDRADEISRSIRDANDHSLALESRLGDLDEGMAEHPESEAGSLSGRNLEKLYSELKITLPELVVRRFDEVEAFHASIVSNRRKFLERERIGIEEELRTVRAEITRLDKERSELLRLLETSMALETFRETQRALTRLDSDIVNLENAVRLRASAAETRLRRKTLATEAEYAVRTELAEHSDSINGAVDLFSDLAEEIYGGSHEANLRIDASDQGALTVAPELSFDSSTGISEVKTFIFDLACAVTAYSISRAPRILVHDSLLFDSMDDRQVASCLNIGARLADQHQFQYIVTMNSDRLESIEAEGFDRRDYVLPTRLIDASDSGGLFGFRFD